MSKPKRLKVVKVVYSDPVTTVFWSDGTNTISWCDEHDTYNEFTGFMLCVLKKIVSPQSMRNMFDTFVYGDDKKYIKRYNKKKYNTIFTPTSTAVYNDDTFIKELSTVIDLLY